MKHTNWRFKSLSNTTGHSTRMLAGKQLTESIRAMQRDNTKFMSYMRNVTVHTSAREKAIDRMRQSMKMLARAFSTRLLPAIEKFNAIHSMDNDRETQYVWSKGVSDVSTG